MKKLFVIALSTIACISSFGQDFAIEKVKIKYTKPSFIQGEVPATFSLIAEQKKGEETTSTKALQEGNRQEKFLYGRYKNSIKGSDLVENGEWTVKIIQEEVKLSSQKTVQYNITNPEGQVTGKAWKVDYNYSVNQVLEITNKAGEKIFTKNIPIKSSSSIKTNFKDGKTLSSKSAAEDNFNNHKGQVKSRSSNVAHSSNGMNLKFSLKDDFSESSKSFNAEVVVLDLNKKKSVPFQDVITLNNQLLELLDKVSDAAKANPQKNWHTEALYNEFKAVQEGYEKILKEDMKVEAAGKEPRFSGYVFQGLYKNLLWCSFFMSDFERVYKESAEIQKVDRKNLASNTATALASDLKINWNNIRNQAKTYQQVFNNCRGIYDWYPHK